MVAELQVYIQQIWLRERFPKAKILILEKGVLPQCASTKNAGFACFGYFSEIIDDLKTHSEEVVIQLNQKRYLGLQLLCKNLSVEAFYNQCIEIERQLLRNKKRLKLIEKN